MNGCKSLMVDINRLRDVYRTDFVRFAADCLKIRTKTEGLQPFVLNDVQRDFVQRFMRQLRHNKRGRFIILKARQQGLSTLIEGLMYWWAIYHVGFKGLVLTHLDSATQELFEMTRRYHQNTPELLKPKSTNDSSHELTFRGIESAIKTATAGSPNAGHGSTYQGLHWSEVSRSRNQSDMVAGVLQTVPDGPGTLVFLESTANGIGEYFCETWQGAVRGENEFEPVFYPWFMSREYRKSTDGVVFSDEERAYQALFGVDDEQLAWRQYVINNKMEGSYEARLSRFKEQYPSTAEEAFRSDSNSFIDPDDVEAACSADYEPVGPVVVGIDPARQGKDGTGVIVRQGRVVRYVGRWRVADTMQLAGRAAKLIDEYAPDAVFVDAIGVGAGVYDRLRELGYREVYQAIVSKQADRDRTYVNKRAEIWAEMSQWLHEGAAIPDHAALREDLLMLGFGEDSNGRLKMQSKKNLKRSPDLGDALALTFYQPVRSAAAADDDSGMTTGRRIKTNGGTEQIRV